MKLNISKLKLVIFVCLSPITSLFLNPCSFFITLYRSKVIINGKWSSYLSFEPHSSVLKLFYITQINNINNYGLFGYSPFIGAGLPLKIFWYHSVSSLKLFKEFGVVGVTAAMSFWAFSYFIWFANKGYSLHQTLVVLLAVWTCNFLGNWWCKQNYNSFGWAFFPLFLLTLFNSYFNTATLLLIVISFLSITAAAFAFIITISVFIIKLNFEYLLILLPLCLKCIFDLWVYNLGNSDNKANQKESFKERFSTLLRMLNFIGVRANSQYKRPIKLIIPSLLCIGMSIFPLTVYLCSGSIPILSVQQTMVILFVPIILLWFNQSHIFRFADIQSIFMLILSIDTIAVLYNLSVPILISFWVVNSNSIVNAILFSYAKPRHKLLLFSPPLEPYNIQKLISEFESFLLPIEGTYVHIAYSDPKACYNEIFDNYAVFNEMLCFCANRLDVIAVPDYYHALYKDYKLWGRDAGGINNALSSLKAEYSIVYVKKNELEYTLSYWKQQKYFKVINILDIDNIKNLFVEHDEWKEIRFLLLLRKAKTL